jgi:hypothetical protein
VGFAHAPVHMANEAHDGTAGILCEQAPESLAGWPADALIVSADNALSQRHGAGGTAPAARKSSNRIGAAG